MRFTPEVGAICVLTQPSTEKQVERGENIIPCIVTIEYENNYCWLIRYMDNEQCMMIKKGERYFFKSTN